MSTGAIGIFDSGYGGLTVMKAIVSILPGYDYIYLGDNARTPYGTRSYQTIYEYTLACVNYLFDQGCPLVILACNTASAKALRTIQQKDLPKMEASKRVLGVIRPTAEIIGQYSRSGKVGVLATNGTVKSASYLIEIGKQYPHLQVFQQACPMWVPLIENGEHHSAGADFFVQKYLDEIFAQSAEIDTLLLGCTHYPLIRQKIAQHIPENTTLLSQGAIVADRLKDYLIRHPEMDDKCTKKASRRFLTTDAPEVFDFQGRSFYGEEIKSESIHL